jgi:hypothetical protein
LKSGTRKRTRFTKHCRVKRNPTTRKTILKLGRSWDGLDPAARGEMLRDLIMLGCTRRGLAQDLNVSATNIRFHLDLAELSPVEKQAVKAGASAKYAFVEIKKRRETQTRIDRVRQEQTTSAISDQLAEDIALFCGHPGHIWTRDEDYQPKKIAIVEGDIERLFIELHGAIEMRILGRLPMPRPAAKHMDFKTVCQAVKPDQKDHDFWLSWLVDWLALAILNVAPEAPIRHAAMKKAPALLAAALRKVPSPPVRHFHVSL